MKFKILFMMSVFICSLLIGCVSKSVIDSAIPDPVSNSNQNSTIPDGIKRMNPLDDFATIMPDANVFDTIVHDIDGNGEDDYIILYSVDDDSHRTSAGLAVCLSNSLYSAINLDSNNRLTFASKATLTFNEGIPIISVSLKDSDSGVDYIYSVEYTIDGASGEANYSIMSEVKK